MSITILNPGMLTSVQDLGRIGYQQFGVSVSGVMDPRSASIAASNCAGVRYFSIIACARVLLITPGAENFSSSGFST